MRTAALLGAGDRVLLVDAKERRYLITYAPAPPSTPMSASSTTTISSGYPRVRPSSGAPAGGSGGASHLSDAVLKMPRGAQVIYPKDFGAILIEADIAPGCGAGGGVGSGALSMALLRAGAEVVGYELREDFAERARANVAAMVGDDAPTESSCATSTRAFEDHGLDRILLDLPEPWQGASPCPGSAPPRWDPVRLSSVHQPDSPAAHGHGRPRIRARLHTRGLPPDLAHRGQVGPPRPPDGRPHRFHHHCPGAGALRRSTRARLLNGAGELCPMNGSALLDEDALPGALLGRLDHGVLEVGRAPRPCRRIRPARSSRPTPL
jgi:hypothetical protein